MSEESVPEDLIAALEARGARERFERLPPSHRREYARWVAEAKRDETRESRAAKAVEMLRGGEQPPG